MAAQKAQEKKDVREFVFYDLDLNKLENEINARLVRGWIKIVALSQFRENIDGDLEATGYAKIMYMKEEVALRPLRILVLKYTRKLIVRAGVLVVEVPINELMRQGE